MACPTEFVARLVVVRGTGLPKTDRLSAIDAYGECWLPNAPGWFVKVVLVQPVPPWTLAVVLTLDKQKMKTKTIDDNQNPVWNQASHEAFYKLSATQQAIKNRTNDDPENGMHACPSKWGLKWAPIFPYSGFCSYDADLLHLICQTTK